MSETKIINYVSGNIRSVLTYNRYNKFHNSLRPARIHFYDSRSNIICAEYWYINGLKHNEIGPAKIHYYRTKNKNIQLEEYYQNDKLHRLDGPAVLHYRKNGQIECEYWHIYGNEIKQPFDACPLTNEQQVELKLIYK